MPARWVAVAAVALLAGSCGSTATTSVTRSATGFTVSSAAQSLPTTTSTTDPPPTSTTGPVTGDQVPDLLVAHAGGITQVGAGVDWYRGEAVAVAVPDLGGGVVFQRRPEPGVPIEHLAAPGADPTVLVETADTDRLTLLDVFRLAGAPTLAYTRSTRLPNECPPEDAECLWGYDITYLLLQDLGTGVSVDLGAVGSFESDRNGYRFGADRYVSVWTGYGEPESCVGFDAVSELLAGASPDRWLSARGRCRIGPPDDCTDDLLCRGGTLVSPARDGSAFAYTAGGFPAPLEVLVIDAGSGAELRRLLIGEAATQTAWTELEIAWMEFDGVWIVIGRRTPLGEELPTLVVRPDGTVEELEFSGRASFWGSPG